MHTHACAKYKKPSTVAMTSNFLFQFKKYQAVHFWLFYTFKVSINKNVESLNISNTVSIVCHFINHKLKNK